LGKDEGLFEKHQEELKKRSRGIARSLLTFFYVVCGMLKIQSVQ
jgi:hypothetical protein